jgi:hypothetical protein
MTFDDGPTPKDYRYGAQPTRKVQRIGYIFCIGKKHRKNPQLLFKN